MTYNKNFSRLGGLYCIIPFISNLIKVTINKTAYYNSEIF